MNTYSVYYKKDSHFEIDENLTLNDLFASNEYVFVKSLMAVDLEQVFQHMQAEIWSPNGEARPLIEALGLRHTSMSVGDLIWCVNDHTFHQVDSFGFRKVL